MVKSKAIDQENAIQIIEAGLEIDNN